MTNRFGLNFEELDAALKRASRMGVSAADLNALLGGTLTSARDQRANELAQRLAYDFDKVVLGALKKRDLTLIEALPRLTRQVAGGTTRILLDGQVMVEIYPLHMEWSEDGHICTAKIESREMPL